MLIWRNWNPQTMNARFRTGGITVTKIIGLDQGTHITGYAVMVDDKFTAYDVLRMPPKKGEPADKRQRAMKEKIKQLLFREQPDYIGVEGVHLGENPATLIMLAEFRGRVCGMAEDNGFW